MFYCLRSQHRIGFIPINLELEQKGCSLKEDKLLEKHEWIAIERQLFGKEGIDYDFSAHNPSKARDEYDRLQVEQSRYKKNGFPFA